MTSDSEKIEKQKEEDELIQRDILQGRKFSIAEAIGREGGSFIKGHNPIPPLDQVISLLTVFVADNINDPSRVLVTVLQRTIKNDRIKIAEYIETPMVYLHGLIKSFIENPHQLYEITREVDFTWGQINNDKPHFQKPGEPAHSDDEYSHEIVEKMLADLLAKIEKEQ
jgi:hypothetical protein